MVMPCICPGSVHAKVHLLHHKQATMAVEMKGFIVLLLFAFSIVNSDYYLLHGTKLAVLATVNFNV